MKCFQKRLNQITIDIHVGMYVDIYILLIVDVKTLGFFILIFATEAWMVIWSKIPALESSLRELIG
jgi:hypothetical protein